MRWTRPAPFGPFGTEGGDCDCDCEGEGDGNGGIDGRIENGEGQGGEDGEVGGRRGLGGVPLHPLRWRQWLSAEHWTERIIVFNASWFTVSMGTGVCVQVLTNTPYPAGWLTRLAYCFWLLTILLFLFFACLSCIRACRFPALTRAILQDFYQTSYLGAVPVTLDTITVGVTVFYGERSGAVWAAWGLWWVGVVMAVLVGCVIVFVTCAWQEAPELKSVTGVWLLSFIPLIVTSSVGATLVPLLPRTPSLLTLCISFLMWSLGIIMSLVTITIYFWRLVRHKLPVREAIVSCFIPMGPTGMGAYSIQNLAVGLATHIQSHEYLLARSAPPPSILASPPDTALLASAVAESLHWLGILTALLLLAYSTFWLLLALFALLARAPRNFNVGFWAFVFPVGVYTNACCALARDLDNGGFRVWAMVGVVATLALWCGCAGETVWRAVWCGELFFAPGLEGWNERRAVRAVSVAGVGGDRSGSGDGDGDGERDEERADGAAGDAEMLDKGLVVTRTSRPDGTYAVKRSRRKKEREREQREKKSSLPFSIV